MTRKRMEFDVVVVGAGPPAGAVFEPRTLNELIPAQRTPLRIRSRDRTRRRR